MSHENGYIHGFSEEEQARLIAQNEVLASYIYKDIELDGVSHLVEIGCGVGAQMITLLHHYPDLYITGIEYNPKQLQRASYNLGLFPELEGRYAFIEGDAAAIVPRFTHPPQAALMVWVLEHVSHPVELLSRIRSWLPDKCPLYITEVFQSTFQLWPPQTEIMAYWQDTIRCQKALGGDANIGCILSNLLFEARFSEITTYPFTFFLDRSKGKEREIMLHYWLELMRSVFHSTLEAGFTTFDKWQRAEAAMRTLIEREDSVFYCSFVQAKALK